MEDVMVMEEKSSLLGIDFSSIDLKKSFASPQAEILVLHQAADFLMSHCTWCNITISGTKNEESSSLGQDLNTFAAAFPYMLLQSPPSTELSTFEPFFLLFLEFVKTIIISILLSSNYFSCKKTRIHLVTFINSYIA